MLNFNFADGEDLCTYRDGAVTKYSSQHIERYKRTSESLRRTSEWKHTGDNAIFRGDGQYRPENITVSIGGVYPLSDTNFVYSFTVNQSSGIYKKSTGDEKSPEEHIINSNSLVFSGGMVDVKTNTLAVSVQSNDFNSDIGLFDLKTCDYRLVTDGDTLDSDPYISPDEPGIIYFSTRGVGRDGHGEFAAFSPSAICRLDTERMDVKEIKSSPDYNYFKPVRHGGKLYAIRAPFKERKSNFFLDLILFPYRIVKAIAVCVNLFVTSVTGKSLTEGGANPARGREYDSKKLFIAGNMVDVEKNYKKNASKKDSDFGFIPKSWQLVDLSTDEVIKSGIGDFDIAEDGTIIATNGRRIFAIAGGECKKVAEAEFCVKVNCLHSSSSASQSSVFDL